MSGPHTSWADSGTATMAAIGPGRWRPSPRASGGARTRSAPVATTESANPSEDASHGSRARRTATDSERTAIPVPRRPRRTASIATADIVAARTTLGSGVTRSTNPPSATRPAVTRAPRESRQAAARTKASPTTIAQLAPDTAVRCERDEAFMSESRSSPTREVSPTASPGMRPAPGEGRPALSRPSDARRSATTASAPPGGSTCAVSSRTRTMSTARSPGSAANAVASARTRAPTSSAVGRSSKRSVTGTPPGNAWTPAEMLTARASARHPTAVRSGLPVSSAVTSSARPAAPSTAAVRAGAANAAVAAAVPANARATIITATTAPTRSALRCGERRTRSSRATPTPREGTASAGHGNRGGRDEDPRRGGDPRGAGSRDESECACVHVTPRRAHGCRRASCPRCPARRADRRRW